MQTVKNKTTVLLLVFEEFLKTSVQPLISVLYVKGYHDFLLKNFCLRVPKNFVEEPLCFKKSLVSKNIRNKRGGGYHNFPSKLFCLTVPKIFVGEPFSVSLISGTDKFYASEGYITIFYWNIFVPQCRKFS